jgi:DNA-binding transcriptional MerR regulator
MEGTTSEFMTAGDAAKEVGITAMGIKAAADRGALPVAATTSGGIRLFRRIDVENFKKAREEYVRGRAFIEGQVE